ncbi:MAG: hypothetical protein V9F82_10405 [Dermatophilaceae bacterium]
MARPVEGVTRADADVLRYDDLSFYGVHGRVGLTLYMPSARMVAIHGAPDIVAPYSAGWGEGLTSARAACEALTRAAHVMAVVVEYPRRRLGVADILPFRTTVLTEVVRHIMTRTIYDTSAMVLTGYSRGTAPARRATLACSDLLAGLCLVAPTWFERELAPHELAARGLAESARGMTRGSWYDRLGLFAANARLAQEMMAHPFDLRNDVAAISQEGVEDLADVLSTGLPVGVVAGRQDELCPIAGIRAVIDGLGDHGVDFREVDSDHFNYFLHPKPLAVVADLITGLGMSHPSDGDEALAQ